MRTFSGPQEGSLKGTHWAIGKTTRGIKVIQVKTPRLIGEQTEHYKKFDVLCEEQECDGSLRPSTQAEDFPYPKLGVIVRFANLQMYECEKCHTTTVLDTRVIDESLSFIYDRLLTNERATDEQIIAALTCSPTSPLNP